MHTHPIRTHLAALLLLLGFPRLKLPALADTVEDVLAILVELQLGDADFGWVDADRDRLAVDLLA